MKAITNYQLATTFAELINEGQEQQKAVLAEQKAVLERIKEAEKSITAKLQRLQSFEIMPKLDDLRLLEQSIGRTTTDASKKIESSLKSLVYSKYMLVFVAVLVLFSFAVMFFSVQRINSDKDEIRALNYKIELLQTQKKK